ncbi:MBL fold metallo-hydrolase [Cellulomonas dongxiuzhuiae]|uniref:MBL fold metallo-hydrolase n=1 Tax=Cellulomonas dongxiuzhuiae TaxID=2819979 RepID=A0ABX8GH82_9CELL|nr:MBL fold metallo-hydrolase [Cellulomonas dongxiuzhuiae]MBO3094483.1 MBL fold metallo-hydrolase [Cellulomonas dongxiuzhuiae]QWC15507.1 MBL fold metallo-hydrolase [Cellulomonas dongxiuzhuiae]
MTTMTFLGHSCVRLDRDGQSLVIDPGSFSAPDALDGATGVLVTHEHADHVDPGSLQSALATVPGLQVWGTAAVVDLLTAAGVDASRLHALAPGDTADVVGFSVTALGGQHAVIHPDIPRAHNLAYLVDGTLLHPGDSFTPAPAEAGVEVLLLPAAAPWLKLSEAVDYGRSVGARTVVPIHTGIYNDNGIGLVDRVLGGLVGEGYRRLASGETLDVSGG